MASKYTCRACLRALSNSSSTLQPATAIPRASTLRIASQCRRNASTTPRVVPKDDSSKAPIAPIEQQPKPRSSITQGLAAKIRQSAPLMTETYVAYGATQDLIKECVRQGEYKIPQALDKNAEIPRDATGAHIGIGEGWWYETLGLQATFVNWAQITFIHMYMLQVRFRMFPTSHASLWIQHLTNHAFYAAEDRLVVWHKLNSNALRQRYLKDMFSQWRAVLLSYDEGLVKGDAVLAAAVWRNLFAGREDVDFEMLAQVVAYMRREIRRLDEASDDDVAQGLWKFESNPGTDVESVVQPSQLMRQNERA